jgi:hypothetical protein
MPAATPELSERLMRHDQTVAQSLEDLDKVVGGLRPKPVQIQQDVRVNGHNSLTEHGVDLLGGDNLIANEIAVV